jgi:hypothetical protein
MHLEPLGWVGGPIILFDLRRFEVQGPTHPLQVMGNGFDSACIVPPPHRENTVGEVGHNRDQSNHSPLFTLLLFEALMLQMPVFNPVVE